MPASVTAKTDVLLFGVVFFLLITAAPVRTQSTPEVPQASTPSSPTQAPAQNPEAPQTSPEPQPEVQAPKPTKRVPSADARREAWKLLEDAASGEKTEQRAAAIRALGLLPGDSRAGTLAEKALKDEKAEVRSAAAFALGELQSRRSVPALRAALEDPEPSVALAAAQALAEFKDQRAYDVYYEVLTGERKTGKGLISSQKSLLKDPKKLATLGLTQGVGFIPFGGFGVEAFKMLTKDDVSPVRASSARMLASDPDPASIKALEDATSDKSWLVRIAALEALAKRNNPVALDTVELSMYDDKDVVQYTAAASFLRLLAAKEKRPVPKRTMRSRPTNKISPR